VQLRQRGWTETDMTLTQEQIDFFFEQGYLRCGKILKDDEIKALRREYDRVFSEVNATNLAAGGRDAAKADGKRMLQIMNVFERNSQFHRLVYDARFLDVVQDLIGPNIMLFHDQALFKPARTGGAVFWHQDNAYWKCRPANLVSCWLTLDDVTRENGAMQVIPGSHLKPAWHGETATSNVLIETKVDDSKAVVVDLPAGGCMFHHCQTLHYTQPNETDRQRHAFIMHYMTPGTCGKDGKIIGVDYHHPVLRLRM
jgi:ectoine hydroxylase-related dioxygenase (phytanoyl-CoA dioxygenase family)